MLHVNAPTRNPFYLSMGALSAPALADLAPFFNNLPDNAYQDGGYRKRRFSAFIYENGNVRRLPKRAFAQSADINHFQGGVVREYEDMEDACCSSRGFQEMMAHFCAQSKLSEGVELEIHQLRIFAQPNGMAEVAPEGVHQDGYNRIGMFMINYENLNGGEIRVHQSKDAPAFVERRFHEGEYIVLNDALFWHDANDIHATRADRPGNYDLFVVTARQPE